MASAAAASYLSNSDGRREGATSGDKFDSSIEISFQYGIGILLFRRPVLNMVLRFGILTYVLTAAAPAAAPDRVLRSVFNTVLRSGREGQARQFGHVLSARHPKPPSQLVSTPNPIPNPIFQ